MAVTTAYKRLLLRDIYRNRGDKTLLEALNARADTAISRTDSGSFVTSTSNSGMSVSFATDKDNSPTMLAEAISALLDLYDLTLANISDTTDSGVYTGMMARLKPARSVTNDWTNLRNTTA